MDVTDFKNVFFHGVVRRDLQSGRYLPGERIDPTALAAEHDASVTPVKSALLRLVGQGMLVERVRVGIFVPVPTEAVLRDLYDGMQLMLNNALDAGFLPGTRWKVDPVQITSPQDDLVKQNWRLFNAIARASNHRFIYETVKHLNDRLAPVRRSKQGWIENIFDELYELNHHWQQRNIPALRSGIQHYHERRKDLVPEVVARLNESRD